MEVRHHPRDLAKHIGDIFSITPQAVYRHISKLESDGYILSAGKGKGKTYELGDKREHRVFRALDAGVEEDRIWTNDFAFIFEGLSQNVIDICHYAFTEMVNNVIDHSDGKNIGITAIRGVDLITVYVADNGEGIFRRIARLCGLQDEKLALFELSKGKLTTDPDNHSGEGIFFASRVMDRFCIESKGLKFTHHDGLHYDFLEEQVAFEQGEVGTWVAMNISRNSDRTVESIFDEYTDGPTEFRFDRTVVPLELAQYDNEKLVSRSQAKRVLARVDKFSRVLFDFEGVETVGQAFADEIFRVYANKNPETVLVPVHMTSSVEKMVNKAIDSRKD